MRRSFALLILFAFLANTSPVVASDPVGDFFKKVGRTLFPPPPKQKATSRAKKKPNNRAAKQAPGVTSPAPPDAAEEAPSAPPPAAPVTASSPPPPPIPVRSALRAPAGKSGRDLPYGVPIPKLPGLVRSPYSPSAGFVDVRDFPSGTEVKDPYTGKIFLTP